VAAGALDSSAATPGIPAIYVNYNADCTFSLSFDGGTTVTSSTAPGPTLPPGVYQLLVWMPNPNTGYACGKPVFTLAGPGVSATTAFQGQELHDDRVIPALLPSSTYVAQDASAPAATQRVFTTAASGSNSVLLGTGTSTSGTGTSTQPDLIGSKAPKAPIVLLGAVTAKGLVTLKRGGKNVATLKAGKYSLRVADATRQSGFSVERAGHKAMAVTTARFVGKRTAKLTLVAGRWTYFSPGQKPSRFVVVA
jgi:hypothetical protein